MHLAMTGLWPLKQPGQAAYRLFMADGLIKAGLAPRDRMRALGHEPGPVDRMEQKAYEQAELRVPPGNGIESGEWTRGGAGSAATG